MDRVTWIDPTGLRNPVAVVAFDGWGDAGSAATIVVEHLLDRFASRRLAVIDADEFFDFQVERPVVELDERGASRVEWADTEIYAIAVPGLDRDVVLIVGEEPHTRWKLFSRTLADVLTFLGVTEVVTLGAFASQVPHTLPVPVVGTSTLPDILLRADVGVSDYQGPIGLVGILNHVLVERGMDVVSLWAAVPHYLSNQDYPPGGLVLLVKVGAVLGVDLDVSDLDEIAAEFRREVDEAVDDSELRNYVEDLETRSGDPADRLMNEIERFLRDR